MNSEQPYSSQQPSEAFSAQIADTLNSGAIGLMISIGHQSGLFDVLDQMRSGNSHQIATRANLSERYVREWLSVMTVGGIVIYDPDSATFLFPSEHAASLTRAAAPNNLAVYAQYLAMMGKTEEKLLECFRSGQGMRYDDFPGFHEIMAQDSEQSVVTGIVDTLQQLVPEVYRDLQQGIDVLDAGCGKGHGVTVLAELFPASRFQGVDLCASAVEDARRLCARKGLQNLSFNSADLCTLEDEAKYNLACSFDAVHDTKDPQQVIDNLHRALRRDGIYLMQDIGGSARLENNIDFPFAAFLYSASCSHCTPVSIGQGGEGLGTMWGWETAERMLHQAGFTNIQRHRLEHDPMNVWFVSRKRS